MIPWNDFDPLRDYYCVRNSLLEDQNHSMVHYNIYRLVLQYNLDSKNHKNENSTRFLKGICKKKHTMRISKMRSDLQNKSCAKYTLVKRAHPNGRANCKTTYNIQISYVHKAKIG